MTILVIGTWNNRRIVIKKIYYRVSDMPIRLVAPRHRYTESGFTLLEVLVVMVIIGVILSFVVISIGGTDPQGRLKREAQRLAALIELAAEEAVLLSQDLGIHYKDGTYQFLQRNLDLWQPVKDTMLRPRTLPSEMSLEITHEGLPIVLKDNEKSKEKAIPHVYLLSSGEFIPFEIRMQWEDLDQLYVLTGSAAGELSIDLQLIR